MRPEDETKDARLTIALPSSIAAWVRDRARSMGTHSSKLCFDWIIEKLYTEQGIRKPSEGIPEAAESLKAVISAAEAGLSSMGMIRSGREIKRRRSQEVA